MKTQTSGGLKALKLKHPYLSNFSIPNTNIKIYNQLKVFNQKEPLAIAALIQNPYKKTDLKEIKNHCPQEVITILYSLNKFHSGNTVILKNFTAIKDIALLFLISHKIILSDPSNCPREFISKKKLTYSLKILEKIDITEVKVLLEDVFFSLLEPKLYATYTSLLKITRRKYLSRQKEIVNDFQKLLSNNKIKAKIESRIKTIYSIHNKITKKNLLFYQILDNIGIRIIVEREEECYKAMVLILKNNTVISSRIKDYIAIPKENGYQSIHFTILYESNPVEIQIRTWEMHLRAQYGKASHLNYKTEDLGVW